MQTLPPRATSAGLREASVSLWCMSMFQLPTPLYVIVFKFLLPQNCWKKLPLLIVAKLSASQLLQHQKRRLTTEFVSNNAPSPRGWFSPIGGSLGQNGPSDSAPRHRLQKARTPSFYGILGITADTAPATIEPFPM
jgi:hypothetical protein